MLEKGQKRNWNFTWAGIAVVVLLLLAVVQVFRVNPPESGGDTRQEKKPVWTEGSILSGVAHLPANGYLSFPLFFNRRVTLKGYFTTGDSKLRLASTIIKADDFEKWKTGGEVVPVNSTGVVPRGFTTRVMEPGNYVLLLDNRMNDQEITLTETDFKVE